MHHIYTVDRYSHLPSWREDFIALHNAQTVAHVARAMPAWHLNSTARGPRAVVAGTSIITQILLLSCICIPRKSVTVRPCPYVQLCAIFGCLLVLGSWQEGLRSVTSVGVCRVLNCASEWGVTT
jgi:hypothetical protein